MLMAWLERGMVQCCSWAAASAPTLPKPAAHRGGQPGGGVVLGL